MVPTSSWPRAWASSSTASYTCSSVTGGHRFESCHFHPFLWHRNFNLCFCQFLLSLMLPLSQLGSRPRVPPDQLRLHGKQTDLHPVCLRQLLAQSGRHRAGVGVLSHRLQGGLHTRWGFFCYLAILFTHTVLVSTFFTHIYILIELSFTTVL